MIQRIFLSCSLILISLFGKAQTAVQTKQDGSADSMNRAYREVEQEAEFPGGETAWKTYLANNLDTDIPITKKAPKGQYTVIIRFIVSKDGSIYDVIADTHLGYGMEEEVIRVIKNSPYWMPGIQNGRRVNAIRRQPVTFVVQ